MSLECPDCGALPDEKGNVRHTVAYKKLLGMALAHIDSLCLADWSAGDNAESDRAQTFVRDLRGRYPSLKNGS